MGDGLMSDVVDEVLTAAGALRVQGAGHDACQLVIWTVYESPLDYPGRYVARPSVFGAVIGAEWSPLVCHLEGCTLSEVRDQLPGGLFCIERAPLDDAVIVEVWV